MESICGMDVEGGGMLLDSQFDMVHPNQVYIPQHENIALQIKSQQLQGKLLL